jgi:hypothetical protein
LNSLYANKGVWLTNDYSRNKTNEF